MNRTRVLFVTEQSDRSEAALMDGISRLDGFEARIVGSPDSTALRALQNEPCSGQPLPPHVTELPISGRFDLRAIRSIRALLPEYAPHIVHAFTARALSTATLACIGLGRSRAPIRIGYRGTAGHLTRWNPADWVTYLHPSLGGIMCVSDAVRDSLIAFGLPPEKLFTVYKGHQVSWYDVPAPRSLLTPFGIPHDAVVVGSNANMRPVKGIDLLLEAALQLPCDGSIHYLLVGEVRDPKVAALAQHPKLAPIVHLVGYRTDATALMHACDIFVIPSRDREGLPKALIEAMSGGLPVVASRVGGIPEVVRDGVDGILCNPNDIPALRNALMILLEHAEHRLSFGKNAKARVSDRFTVANSVSELARHYHHLPSRFA